MNDLKLIDKFCSTLDAQYLYNLTEDTRDTLINLCIIAMKKGSKKYVARKILHFYGLDDKGKPLTAHQLYPRKRAEETLATFSVALTGAQVGDILIGRSNVSKGAIIKVLNFPIYPQSKIVDRLLGHSDLWKQYLVKLGGVPFFARMSVKERDVWIKINKDPSDLSIGDGGNKIELLQPGTSDFVKKLDEEQLEQLINGTPGGWTSDEIEAMFPGKPGSKARKHTLILFREMWKLAVDHEIDPAWTGLTINVDQGVAQKTEKGLIYILNDITKEYVKKGNKWVRPVGKKGVQQIGFQVSEKMAIITTTFIDELIAEILPTVGGSTSPENIRQEMKNFTGAAYKSLLQKLIRFRAKNVQMLDGQIYDAQLVLLVVIGELARYPGSFVPDIQRYVTGLESLAKRLAMTILEDSSIDNETDLVSLFSGALVAQRIKVWTPSRKLLKKWMQIGLKGLNNPRAYIYNSTVIREPLVIKKDSSSLELSSALLDELRSFEGDLALVRDIATNKDLLYTPPPNIATPTPKIMPIIHCVDQHWMPIIVYFYDPVIAKEAMKESSVNSPFQKLMEKLFLEVTGFNFRRHYNENPQIFNKRPFVRATRQAQELVMIAKQTDQIKKRALNKIVSLKYTLDIGWLSGMVGALEIPGTPPVLVTLRSDDPLQLVVIRRPSRDMSDSELSPERNENAIKAARKMLINGVPLNKVQAPAPIFKGAKLYLLENEESGDEYMIETADGQKLFWEQACKLQLKLPIYPYNKFDQKQALFMTGDGVMEHADRDFAILLQNTPATVLRRVMVYLSGFNSLIEMNRVSRDGGSVYHAVVYEDVEALQFMYRLSWLYPGALRPEEYTPGKFIVPVGPLLWTVVKKIKLIISKEITTKVSDKWLEFKLTDKMKRKLWTHQTDALHDMQNQHQAGGKGNFISIPVGMGKTAIVMSYLAWLQRKRQLPKHIIYTLPQSAIKSVIKEIQAFGFAVDLLIPLKSIAGKPMPEDVNVTQDCRAKPFTVTVIEHDYLRRCEAELVRIASDAIFVIDEVHKALNDTKRTSVALEISHLSKEFIALTGTPVIDSKTYKLIWWLSQVVPFEVNERNFWVAANNMIAKKASTGVIVNRQEIVAQFNSREEKRYAETVPPALGGINSSPSNEDWQAAVAVSYEACTRVMVKETANFLRQKRGVMVVAKDKKHQEVLYQAILQKANLRAKQIFVLKSNDSIFLTDDEVESGKVPDYRVVIVPIRKAEGYTLTRLSAMVSSVYPSNNATREQIEGRINRIGQKSKTVEYRIVHAGILTRILQHHNDAKSLSLALQSIAQEI